MPPSAAYLAIDLGAGSCRILAVTLVGGALRLEEIDRFATPLLETDDGLFWHFEAIWVGLRHGLRKAARQFSGQPIAGLGVDSWAVDYAYVSENGELLGPPHAYRDPRTKGLAEAVQARIGRERLFARTGLQFLPFNTLYQCAADIRDSPDLVERAFRILLIADLVSCRLSGRMAAERTNASTTQFYNPLTRDWDRELTAAIGLPSRLLPELVDPGTVYGSLRSAVRAATGLPDIPVIGSASHDTASAVAAVPARGPDFAYLSLGTWALLGSEIGDPLLDPCVLNLNFTNETGVGNTIRLLKNINGLWIIQECRRIWRQEDGSPPEYEALSALAAAAKPCRAFIDSDAPIFAGRCDMPEAIRDFCRRTGQFVPEDRGSVLRVAMDSLAWKVAVVLRQLESLTGKVYPALHVVGGGTRDPLLMQTIATALGRPVEAGPVEATALGNALVQMMVGGAPASLWKARELVRASFPPHSYFPEPHADWSEPTRRFDSFQG
ncbi:MAG TPA: rhamnulokinase family protein [Verrucomicrobiales bacterium]|nr:rhamnulokinase family protein [Verrucomicrobiales bacterium]